jgi:hypothetical protein
MLEEPNIIKNLENIIGLENIFFMSINKIFIDQQRIFSALGIRSNIRVESRKLNRTVDLIPTLKQLQILIKIKDWVKENETRLEEISKKSKDMIQEKYLKELY